MLVFYMFSNVFPMFSNIFHTFSRTNLLTRCPVPVSVYFVYVLQKRSKNESSRNGLKFFEEFLFTGRLQKPE